MKLQTAETTILAITIFFVAFLGYGILKASPKVIQGMHTFNAVFAGVPMTLIIADEPAEYKVGLSELSHLPRNQGMLFVFDKPDKWRVSTKGLNFPIDIFWLDENFVVIDMYRYAPPSDYYFIFTPKHKAKYILETNADFADIHNIEIGDKLYLQE